MPDEELRVIESLQRRPLRTLAIVAAVTVCFASSAAIRQHYLQQDALTTWSERSATISRLTAASASSWLRARQGDVRLIAVSAGRNPQLFGIPTPGKVPVTGAGMSAEMAQTLTALNQLHSYSAIWMFDRSGRRAAVRSAGSSNGVHGSRLERNWRAIPGTGKESKCRLRAPRIASGRGRRAG
jgi:hypothetical protein